MDTLQSLIRSLQTLYFQIGSRLLQNRMYPAARSETPRESFPIKDLVADRIVPASPVSPHSEPSANGKGSSTSEVAPRSATARSVPRASKRVGTALFSALSSHFTGRRRSAFSQPFMREKMRDNTLDHVKKALSLARRGDEAGAKIHAELAENAMTTAGAYMTDDEYGELRKEVERRLASAPRLH